MFNTEQILQNHRLFWQYPVITEQQFYTQNKHDDQYCGVPWATLIDKRTTTNDIVRIVLPYMKQLQKNKGYTTCCQHISFRTLLPMFKSMGITTVYTPHKIKGEDYLYDIKLMPCPLYAVNIEDEKRNEVFKQCDLLEKKRKYLYSFAGGYQHNCYLTDIRLRIFKLNNKKRQDCMIINTGDWHFNCDVYQGGQDINGNLNENQQHKINTKIYNDILLNSRYTLAPSGSGPNSIRFWEALGVGSIPVLLADTLELPKHELWEKAIVRIKESELDKLDDILSKISKKEEQKRRENCMKIYKHFQNNYRNTTKTVPL